MNYWIFCTLFGNGRVTVVFCFLVTRSFLLLPSIHHLLFPCWLPFSFHQGLWSSCSSCGYLHKALLGLSPCNSEHDRIALIVSEIAVALETVHWGELGVWYPFGLGLLRNVQEDRCQIWWLAVGPKDKTSGHNSCEFENCLIHWENTIHFHVNRVLE